ncbi:undecaprenyl-phosphate glucose phosphotransferase [Lutibacter sp.]|uniref:undecaprenyl-phosphate glucose phosphotransferase n=1 Tax=Lutibacter sp. TaxID=1925666 RepID=UPI001A2A91DA|nr:undecaprenyl-phosphate glucose phosphotransferase [Lutibacter sp.]MBI9041331.1 undecaprenyl-phosphate glucose phosphotransferase [Lutibacter sp.]
MPKGRAKYLPIPTLFIDGILLLNAFLTATYVQFGGQLPDPVLFYGVFGLWYVLWIIISINYKLFDVPRFLYIDQIVSKNVKALGLFILVCAAVLYVIKAAHFSRVFFAMTMVLFSIMFVAWHVMFMILFKAYRRAGNNFKTIAIVGFKAPLEHLITHAFSKTENGYKIVAAFGSGPVPAGLQAFYKGTEDALTHYLDMHHVDELLISLPGSQSKLTNNFLKYCDNHLIRAHIVPNFSGYLFQKFSMKYIENIPTLQLRAEPLESLSNRMLKRFFDVVFATAVLVLIGSWLFPIIAVLIKISSKGPVFFKQQRSGKNGAVFHCLKFRSMTVNGNSDQLQATKNDARITKIGSFLRKTSLDEFPQFMNVLMGGMSVVGPRPHMLKHTDEYGALVDKFMVRHFAKPGITGWAQVLGFRGETKHVSAMENRATADIWYIENWNVFLDLKIIVLTVWQVFFKKEENAF